MADSDFQAVLMFPFFILAPNLFCRDVRYPLSGSVEQNWLAQVAEKSNLPPSTALRQITLGLLVWAQMLETADEKKMIEAGDDSARLSFALSRGENREKDLAATNRLLSSLL